LPLMAPASGRPPPGVNEVLDVSQQMRAADPGA
jgi:hypothetical protein